METITRLIGGLGLIYILYNTFYMWIEAGIMPSRKPFNCVFCLSFWVALTFSIIFNNIIFLSLPIFYYIWTRLNNKL